MAAARAILLEVGGLGMIREILFKQNYLQDPRRATILVDELNSALWVWLGNDVDAKTRKAVIQVAEKIRSEGYQAKADGLTIGQNCQQIIVIDQKSLAEPGVQEKHQTALNLFNMKYAEAGRFAVQFDSSPRVAAVEQEGSNEFTLAGILIASILTTSPELMVSRTSLGIYNIETAEGTLKFEIKEGNIQLLPGSIGINDDIQRAFQENLKYLK